MMYSSRGVFGTEAEQMRGDFLAPGTQKGTFVSIPRSFSVYGRSS